MKACSSEPHISYSKASVRKWRGHILYTVGLIKSDKGYVCVVYVSLILINLFKLFHAIYIMCGYFKQAFSKLPFSCKEFFIYNNDLTYYLSWWFLHISFIMSKMRFGKFLLVSLIALTAFHPFLNVSGTLKLWEAFLLRLQN